MQVIKIDPIIMYTCVQFTRRKELIMYSLPIVFARRGRSMRHAREVHCESNTKSISKQKRSIMEANLSTFASRERNTKSPSHNQN